MFQIWGLGIFGFWGGVCAFLICLAIVVICRFKIKPEHLLVYALLLTLSLFKARFFIFLTILGPLIFLPYVKDHLNSFVANKDFLKSYLTHLSCVLIFFCASTIFYLQGSGLNSSIEYDKYPQKATKFISDFRPKGNLLNPYEWGGFLIVNLPEYKVFVDGRGMQVNSGKLIDFEMLRTGFSLRPNDNSLWKEKMRKYGIRIVLAHRSEQKFPINRKLLADPLWLLAYQDEVANVFLRKPY